MRLIFFIIIFIGFQPAWAKENCVSREIEFEKHGFQVQISKLQSELPNQKSILIIPPTGGSNFIDRSYAESFCESGYDVYVLDRWTDDNEYSLELQIHERFYSRAQQAIGITLSHIKSRFIGIMGTSVGAIHAANAIRSFSKLNAAFLIVGGAPISEVIANSDQDVLFQARQRRFELYGFKNITEYTEALHQAISFDPLQRPANHSIRIGTVIANADTTVPSKNQNELRGVLMPEQVIEVDGNHLFVILKTWICHKREIVHFFNQTQPIK